MNETKRPRDGEGCRHGGGGESGESHYCVVVVYYVTFSTMEKL